MASMKLELDTEKNVSDKQASKTPSISMHVDVTIDSIKTESEDLINQDIVNIEDVGDNVMMLHEDITDKIGDIDKQGILNIEHTINDDKCVTILHNYAIEHYIKIENDDAINNINDIANDSMEYMSSFHGDIENRLNCVNNSGIKSEYVDVIAQDICDTGEATIEDTQHDGAFVSEDHSPGDGLPLAVAREETTAVIQEENKAPKDKLSVKRGNPNATHHKIHSGEIPFQCEICNKSFSKKSNLTKHTRIHIGKKPFLCHICNKSFIEKYHLATHHRTHSGEKPFHCEICNKAFGKKSNLTKHTRIHTGEKPFLCQICKKSFIEKSHLATHHKIHSGEKPYQCEICNRAFGKKSNLTKHTRLHSDEKPFLCHICNKSFIIKTYLTAHQRIHSGEKPFYCDVCNMAFTRKHYLSRHIISKHSLTT